MKHIILLVILVSFNVNADNGDHHVEPSVTSNPLIGTNSSSNRAAPTAANVKRHARKPSNTD